MQSIFMLDNLCIEVCKFEVDRTIKINTAKYLLYLMYFMGDSTVTLIIYVLLLFCFLLKCFNNTKLDKLIFFILFN